MSQFLLKMERVNGEECANHIKSRNCLFKIQLFELYQIMIFVYI